jgi:hypothetical protein
MVCHSERSDESQNFAIAARQILRFAQNDKKKWFQFLKNKISFVSLIKPDYT